MENIQKDWQEHCKNYRLLLLFEQEYENEIVNFEILDISTFPTLNFWDRYGLRIEGVFEGITIYFMRDYNKLKIPFWTIHIKKLGNIQRIFEKTDEIYPLFEDFDWEEYK